MTRGPAGAAACRSLRTSVRAVARRATGQPFFCTATDRRVEERSLDFQQKRASLEIGVASDDGERRNQPRVAQGDQGCQSGLTNGQRCIGIGQQDGKAITNRLRFELRRTSSLAAAWVAAITSSSLRDESVWSTMGSASGDPR